MSFSSRLNNRLCVIALVAVALASCGEGSESAVVPTPSVGTAAVAAATPQAAASVAATPSTPLKVEVLPESVLRQRTAFDYKKFPGPEEVVPEIAAKPETWEGTIVRALYRESIFVGTVQLTRIREGVLTSEEDRKGALEYVMEEFAQTDKFTTVRLGDQTVLTVMDVRGTGRQAAAWLDGRDLNIMFAAERLPIRGLAGVYITDSKFPGSSS